MAGRHVRARAHLLLGGELLLVGRLDHLADPVHLLVVPDVGVLHADPRRVHLLEPPDQVAQLHQPAALLHQPELQPARPEVELLVEVGLGEPVVGELEVGKDGTGLAGAALGLEQFEIGMSKNNIKVTSRILTTINQAPR